MGPSFDKEDVRAFGDADARAVRDDLRRLGDDVGVERDLALGVGLPHVVLQLFAVFAGDEVAAVFLHFGHELVVDGFNRDGRVFGRAGCGVVEQLAAADHLGGFGRGLHAGLDGDGRADGVRPAGVFKADGLDALDDLIRVKALGLADLAALFDGRDTVLSEDAVDLVDSSLVVFK